MPPPTRGEDGDEPRELRKVLNGEARCGTLSLPTLGASRDEGSEQCLDDGHPLLRIMDSSAKRRYRRMAPSMKAKSLRVTGYVAAAAAAAEDVVRRILTRERDVGSRGRVFRVLAERQTRRSTRVPRNERRARVRTRAGGGKGDSFSPFSRAS